jgi:hypothetical protein
MLTCLLFWISVFYVLQRPQSGNKTDSLSGTSYNLDQINADRTLNPNAPYFTGFESLNEYGITEEAQRYTKDFITNYTLYKLEKSQARISFVSGSFKQSIKSVNINYVFKFGINGGDIHNVTVETNVLNSNLKISISKPDGSAAITKSFTPNT